MYNSKKNYNNGKKNIFTVVDYLILMFFDSYDSLMLLINNMIDFILNKSMSINNH